MIIAVNTRFLMKELEGFGYFAKEVFQRMTRDHPEHQFYFLFDRPYDPAYLFSENVQAIVMTPPARHPLLWKYWFDIRVPAVLRRIRADLFVSPDGFCSLRTRVPQCMVVHDLGFLHFPAGYKKSHLFYLKRYTPRFVRKAKRIATVSAFSRSDLVKQYKMIPEKIDVVYSAVKEGFAPLPPDEQQKVQEQYTEGKAYFIYTGAIQPRKNLLNLLKAFSIFKKRQQSNMKLVLAGRMAWKNEAFLRLLKSYKYRSDVVLTGYIPEEELARLVASAYALVYPSYFEGFGVPVLEAMKSGVPALTSAATSMEEIGGEAGLYFDPNRHEDIADKMMLIYKDEDLRRRLIQKGFDVAAQFSWQRTADLLWESMMKAVRRNSAECVDES